MLPDAAEAQCPLWIKSRYARYIRFSPESGHFTRLQECLARSGPDHLLNHLIGAIALVEDYWRRSMNAFLRLLREKLD